MSGLKNFKKSEYPDFFDAEYSFFTYDIKFWRAIVKQYSDDGCVLDLGSGTGRVAIELLMAGYNVDCVDIDRYMLESIRHKVRDIKSKANIRLIKSDITKLNVGKKYSCIISTFNVIPLILSNSKFIVMFKNIRDMLSEDGIFVFDAPILDDEYLDLIKTPSEYQFKFNESLISKRGKVSIRQDEGTFIMKADYYLESGENKSRRMFGVSKKHRIITPQYIDLIARHVGLKVKHTWGDYDKSKLNKYSRRLIWGLTR